MSSSDHAMPLCRLDEIPDPGGRGFKIRLGDGEQEIFVIRRGEQIHGYVNSCPHTGVCLDWQPDQFLTSDNKLIVCSMHGAQFRIEDGLCVSGPCRGDALSPVKVWMDPESGIILCMPVGSQQAATGNT